MGGAGVTSIRGFQHHKNQRTLERVKQCVALLLQHFCQWFLLSLDVGVVGARKDIKVERVSFERGKNSSTIESSITGYAVVDYVLGGALKGQYMNVSMATDNNANYFNILAPGEDQVAMFNGSVNGNQYEGILPGTGDYKVRVYMMRSAARRNEVANYSLTVSITGSVSDAAPAQASTGDDKVKGTPYQATGKVACSRGTRRRALCSASLV